MQTLEIMWTLRRMEEMVSRNTDWKMIQWARPAKSGIWESSYRNLENKKGGREREEENGVWCVMTKLNKMSNRKNYFGSLAGCASPHRPAESVLVFRGRQAADSHERCCSAGFKRSTGSGGGKAASGAQRLIKDSSGLMWDNLCKQCYVGGEQSSNILCD